jgi:hypothetical protein
MSSRISGLNGSFMQRISNDLCSEHCLDDLSIGIDSFLMDEAQNESRHEDSKRRFFLRGASCRGFVLHPLERNAENVTSIASGTGLEPDRWDEKMRGNTCALRAS